MQRYALALSKKDAERVNEYARADILIRWINTPNRGSANIIFTAGQERLVAYAIESALDALHRTCVHRNELQKANERIEGLEKELGRGVRIMHEYGSAHQCGHDWAGCDWAEAASKFIKKNWDLMPDDNAVFKKVPRTGPGGENGEEK